MLSLGDLCIGINDERFTSMKENINLSPNGGKSVLSNSVTPDGAERYTSEVSMVLNSAPIPIKDCDLIPEAVRNSPVVSPSAARKLQTIETAKPKNTASVKTILGSIPSSDGSTNNQFLPLNNAGKLNGNEISLNEIEADSLLNSNSLHGNDLGQEIYLNGNSVICVTDESLLDSSPLIIDADKFTESSPADDEKFLDERRIYPVSESDDYVM